MKKFLVVIWGNSVVTMSLVPLTPELEKEIANDSSVAYDHAQGAELAIPSFMVEECAEHIEGFSTLKNGHIVEVSTDLKQLLLDLIPQESCFGH